jgi:hypothetical protein
VKEDSSKIGSRNVRIRDAVTRKIEREANLKYEMDQTITEKERRLQEEVEAKLRGSGRLP